jgi:NADPH:quinone reductase-like Zn-dependent oxidoreductase
MKVLVFERHGLENFRYTTYPDPEVGPDKVLVKAVMAGGNPVGHYTVIWFGS